MAGDEMNIRDETIAGRHGPLRLRWYEPDADDGRAPLLWLHGGAFSGGNLDMPEAHAVAAVIARTRRRVASLDYRLVPGWSWFRDPPPGPLPGRRYPIPLEDVLDGFAHVRAKAPQGQVVLGGASAGACLAAAAALRLTLAGQGPACLALAYGIFHATLPPAPPALAARLRGRHGLLQFQPQTVRRMNLNYAGSATALAAPHAFPGGHGLSALPPALLLDADRDSLRASGGLFAQELRAAGVPVRYEVIAESRHGFLNRPRQPYFAIGMALLADWLASAC